MLYNIMHLEKSHIPTYCQFEEVYSSEPGGFNMTDKINPDILCTHVPSTHKQLMMTPAISFHGKQEAGVICPYLPRQSSLVVSYPSSDSASLLRSDK